VLGVNCKSSDSSKLLCKVYFRIFRALKTIGSAKEEEVLISNMIKGVDAKFWSETEELRAIASLKLPKKDTSMANIVQMCVAPLLHLLKEEKAPIRKSASDEKEHSLTLKKQGQEMFEKSDFIKASAMYIKAARSGDLTITTAVVLRNLGMCH
jgi:hypothetical protein